MLKKIKLIAALLLLVCLFLPLSTCSRQPLPVKNQPNPEPVVIERYVAGDSGSLWMDYVPVVVFVLPLLWVLLSFRQVLVHWALLLAELLNAVAVLAVVYLHDYTGRLVLGGYLAASASITLLLLVILQFVGRVRQGLQQQGDV